MTLSKLLVTAALILLGALSDPHLAQAAPGPITKVAKKTSKKIVIPQDVKLPRSTKGLPDLWLATSEGWKLSVQNVNIREDLGGSSSAKVGITGTQDSAALLGKEATVAIRILPKGFRYYNGYITKVEQVGQDLSLTIEPSMALLSKTATAAVFENETIPKAMSRVMARHPLASFRFELDRRYKKRSTIVQYRETDKNFVSRLAEDLGLLATVEHKRNSHQLVFSDIQRKRPNRTLKAATMMSWSVRRQIAATRYVLRSQKKDGSPTTTLSALHSKDNLAGMEVFDYEPTTASDAELRTSVDVRLQEMQARTVSVSGGIEDPDLQVGDVLRLQGHPTDDGNYLVTEIVCQYYENGSGLSGGVMFSAIPASTTFRPARKTPWPTIAGIQRAQVVKIDSAKHRLRIRFPWDRSKAAAGKGSTWVAIPASKSTSFTKGDWISIGFSEGEPSLPIVLGL